MNEPARSKRRALLVFLMVIVPALLLLAWSQASFNLYFIRPSSAQQTILLLALSAINFLAFVIFAVILGRILLKLYAERRQGRLGSRFKTKMVAAFLGLSLVPVCFLFAFAYGLLNRSVDKWFGIPFDIVRKDSAEIVRALLLQENQRALDAARRLSSQEELRRAVLRDDRREIERLLARQVEELDAASTEIFRSGSGTGAASTQRSLGAGGEKLATAICFDSKGQTLARAGAPGPGPSEILKAVPELAIGQTSRSQNPVRLPWPYSAWLVAAEAVEGQGRRLATVAVISLLPLKVEQLAAEIEREAEKYDALSQERRAVKVNYLFILGFVTLLILFMATWLAMFLAKQVTIPIQALAEATHAVSRGDLGFQIQARADDELGSLIQSFNAMTRQLQENRQALERAAKELQEANRALEEHSNTMEAILESIPTGVISFDPNGRIIEANTTVERMLGGEKTRAARSLTDLFSAEEAGEISRLFVRAARQGAVTRLAELELSGRRATVALTVSSIRAADRAVGSVLVLEDLTELLRAQKAAAWGEVAQRIAHEIKNPLTPIRLSAERIERLVSRGQAAAPSEDFASAISDSAALIDREVATLKTLVDEFSNLARFPVSQPVPSNLNAIVENGLNVFDGRLKGIQLHRELSAGLPLVEADPEQMKRALVNLIDNAAEALEKSASKEIWVRTALDTRRDIVELVVADSGPGIPLDALDKLFLPYFSTKRRGTGLGLAIVSRIISEHHGTIRVEENRPSGAKFVIELPVDRGSTGER